MDVATSSAAASRRSPICCAKVRKFSSRSPKNRLPKKARASLRTSRCPDAFWFICRRSNISAFRAKSNRRANAAVCASLIQKIRAEEDVPSGGFIVRTAGVGIPERRFAAGRALSGAHVARYEKDGGEIKIAGARSSGSGYYPAPAARSAFRRFHGDSR